MIQREEIRRHITGALQELGIDLVDLVLVERGRRSLIRVFADEVGGIGIDRCAEASRAISDVLDRKNLVPFDYSLEVSSPGVDRPLTTEKEFQRHVNRKARVNYKINDLATEVIGQIVATENGEIHLLTEDSQTLKIRMTDIVLAKLIVGFK